MAELFQVTSTALDGMNEEQKTALRDKVTSGEFELKVIEDAEVVPKKDETLWGKAKSAAKKIFTGDIPVGKTLSDDEYGELLKEDNHATVPTVAIEGFQENKTEPKWKIIQGKNGEHKTMPDAPLVTEEIASGVHRTEAPERPEVDSETEWKRGLLAKTDDIKTNVKNAKRVFEQGGYKLIGVKPNTDGIVTHSNMYKLEKDGNEYVIDEDSFNSAIWDLRGDPASSLVALSTAGIGKAIGLGGLGNMVDQAISKAITGEELSSKQRAIEVGKEAVLFGVGETIVKGAPIALKLGKNLTVDVPVAVAKRVQGYIRGGNLPGATKILGKDLGVSVEHMDDALKEMNTWQLEKYDGAADVVPNIKNIISGDKKADAIKQTAADLWDSTGNVSDQERLLATVMSHPDGERHLVPALGGDVTAATEAMKSVDARVKQAYDLLDSASGTEVKNAVKSYEGRVKAQYGDMRETFKEAFKESGYRFKLSSLKLDDTLGNLEKAVHDPFVKEKFKSMSAAVENIVERSSLGKGIEKDVDDLLDIRQLLNKFYGKNKSHLAIKTDKETFKNMIGAIDDEIESAMEKNLTPEIKERLSDYFATAKTSYKDMYAVRDTKIYKDLMGEGMNAEDRVSALLSHAKDDAKELQGLLGKLSPDESAKAESAIIESVLQKHTVGDLGKLKGMDTAGALRDLEELRKFLSSDVSQKGIDLLSDLHSKFRHDFALYNAGKNVTVNTPAAGIATSATGKMQAATASIVFRYLKSMIPFSGDAKRLAVQRHLGAALRKSRSPIEMAKHMSKSRALPVDQREELKKLIKIHNKALAARNVTEANKIEEELKLFESNALKKEADKVLEVTEFQKPDITELRAVEVLGRDDKYGTLAKTVRNIQDDRATEVDIRRYLDAKTKIGSKLEKQIEKEKVLGLPVKYRELSDVDIGELVSLRDFVGDGEFDARMVERLIYDLKKNRVPRDLKHDALYDDMKEMYEALKPKIDEAYGETRLAQSQTRVPSSLGDADNLVTNHQAVQAEQLPIEGDQLSHGLGNRSMQADEIIAKANEKFKTSKARDDNGNLKILYHGTASDFDSFDINKASNGNFGRGFYFAEDVEKVNKHFVKGAKSNIMPVVLDMETPFNIDDIATAMPVYESFAKEFGLVLPKGTKNPLAVYKLITNGAKGKEAFTNYLQFLGYDGMTGTTPAAGKQYIVFTPTQIKSIHNQGTFSKSDPNILKGATAVTAIGAAATQKEDK